MRFFQNGASATLAGALFWMLLLPGMAGGQESATPWEQHPWAKFGLGSWKQVRVFNESIGENGKVENTSITNTKTTLVDVSDTDYMLKVEVTIEVAGKSFKAETKFVRQGFHGEASGQTAEVQTVGPGEVVIDGRKYPIQVRKVVINGDDLKRVSLVHYSAAVPPHVLKRETKVTDVTGGKQTYESLVEVVAVDMPYRVLSETKLVSHVKTTHKQANGTSSVTLEVNCDDVPGGVVAHSAKEYTSADRVMTRSTLELVEYQVVPESADPDNVQTGRRRVFHRGRNR